MVPFSFMSSMKEIDKMGHRLSNNLPRTAFTLFSTWYNHNAYPWFMGTESSLAGLGDS